jgi:hypothetical protein
LELDRHTPRRCEGEVQRGSAGPRRLGVRMGANRLQHRRRFMSVEWVEASCVKEAPSNTNRITSCFWWTRGAGSASHPCVHAQRRNS